MIYTLSHHKAGVKVVSPLMLSPSPPAINHEAAFLRGLATGDDT
jgi:hypothetical protein